MKLKHKVNGRKREKNRLQLKKFQHINITLKQEIFFLSFLSLLKRACYFAPFKKVNFQTLSIFTNIYISQILTGSTSTGSTKSATMELYVASSYNETMSGGGETLSSISEKSCISAANNHHGEFPPQAYMVSHSCKY